MSRRLQRTNIHRLAADSLILAVKLRRMRFAEVFLRLGCAMVAWMMIYTYVLWLAALHAMGCGPDGDHMHQLLLGLAPAAAAFAFVLRVSRPFPDIHRMLSWLGAPLVLLLYFCLRNTWRVFDRVTLNGAAICGDGAPADWQSAWAPVQLAALTIIAVLAARAWIHARRPASSSG